MNLKKRFSNWINDRLFKYLINRKKEFYQNIINKLNIFDLTTLNDVYTNFPTFEIKSMYLAGGMDAAEDTGRGWRSILEYEFEMKNKSKSSELPKVDLLYKGEEMLVTPSHVVDGIYLDMVIENPNNTLKMYHKPALLNPVRKEVDRNKDDRFEVMFKQMKNPKYDPKSNTDPVDFFRDVFSARIEPDDEDLLRISDAVFLGQDPFAGAGTYGELELLSLIRKPLFAWLVNASENRMGDFKLWNMPHLSKVARNTEEMKILVNTIVRES